MATAAIKTQNENEVEIYSKSNNKINQVIKPARFVWHVKYNNKISDLNIANNGLLCPKNSGVYAHNKLRHFSDMYPWFIDTYDYIGTHWSIKGQEFLMFSFWRIDTSKLDLTWFVDPAMINDVYVYCDTRVTKANNFIFTPNPIPNYALKLFTVDLDRYLSEKSFIKYHQGTASVSPYRNDFDSLLPEYPINNYIDWIIGNKENKNP